MAIPAQKYSAGQKEALAVAFEVRRIRPARRVVEMAAAGELEHQGVRLDPFEANEASVRGYAADLRKRRAGEVSSSLEGASHRDAVERLRVRLVRAADAELRSIERRQAEGVSVPGEEIRQVARAAREIASLPGPHDPAPVAPGLRTPGTDTKQSGKTRGGIAGQILEAHRRSGVAKRDVEPQLPPPPREREPVSEAPSDAVQEIAERVRRRLEPLMAPEPAAPEPAEYRTLPTAMSGASQLDEAREKFGWDPLRSPEPSRRRGRGTWLEDTSSIDR